MSTESPPSAGEQPQPLHDISLLIANYEKSFRALALFTSLSRANLQVTTRTVENVLARLLETPEEEHDERFDLPHVERLSDGTFSVVLSLEARDALFDVVSDSHDDLSAASARMLDEMALSHSYALFEGLLADTLLIALLSRPEQLRSKASLTYEEVLNFSNMNALISELARRRVANLMYGRLETVLEYLATGFEVDITDDNPLDLEHLKDLRDRRNLILHNSGRASAEYAARRGLALGDRLPSTPNTSDSDRQLLQKVGIKIAVGVRRELSSRNALHDDAPGT